MTINSKRPLWSSFVVGWALLAALPSNAADPIETADPAYEEIVVVTGSRIKRAYGAYMPTPMAVTTAETIELSGTVNLGDFLNELPQLRSTFSLQNGSRFIGTTGLNLLDLRGMGTARTLVLQDGRRHIGGNNGTTAVDVNTIPQDLIERVEIITGGASAIYGADAVTGVVNFVMKDDFEGFKIRASTSQPQHDGGEEYRTALTWGQNFSDGRGNVAFAAEWTDVSEIQGVDRDWITDSWGRFFNPNDTGPNDGIPDEIYLKNRTDNRLSASGMIPGPHPLENVFGFPPFFVPFFGLTSGPYTFDNGGNLMPFDPGQLFVSNQTGVTDNSSLGGDGLRFDRAEQLLPDIERINLFGRARFEFNEHLIVKAEFKYAETESRSYGQPTFDFFSDETFILPDNAFIPADLAAIVATEGSGGFYLNRFNYDLGNRFEEFDRETTRFVLSAEGVLFGDWTYDVAGVYAEYDGEGFAGNNRHNPRYTQAVDAIVENGEIVCRDPAARTAGCLPLNLFGENQFNPAALPYIFEPNSGYEEELTQTVFSASANGSLFELPAGSVLAALGVEYRKEESKVSWADELKSGDTFFNALADTDADYDVSEGFVEVSVPVLANLPAIQNLTFDAAARFSDYDTVGGTTTWKWGVDWTVTEDVRLRVTDSRAIRAPNIGELFDPLQQNFFEVDDPCSQTELNSAADPALRLANCTALGRPIGYESVNDASFIGGLSGGNPELMEESSDSLTYGIVLTPRFIPGLIITVDYWEMEIEDAIAVTPAQDILDRCVDGPSIDNIYCPLVTRDADFDINADNGITRATQNISALEVEGIDYEIDYTWELGDTFNGVPGALQFNIGGTHLLTLDEFVFAEDPSTSIDTQGLLGDPENSFVLNTTYRAGSLTLNWRMRWLDDMRLIDNELADELESPLDADSVGYHDVQARYLFGNVLGGSLEVYGGIRNLTDEEPQEYLTGNGGQSGIYDTQGRTYYVGLIYDLGS